METAEDVAPPLGGKEEGEAMEDYDRPASSEEVKDILSRYEHLNISLDLLSEPALPDSQVTQQQEPGAEDGLLHYLQLEKRRDGGPEDVKQTLTEADGEYVRENQSKEGGWEPPGLSQVSDGKSVDGEDSGKKLSNKDYNLKHHISRSLTEKKTPDEKSNCQDCDKTFSQKGSLQAHKIKHTAGGGRVQCEVCEKMFASKGTLLTHQQTHTGKKKYACNLCEESYNSRKDLTSHEKTTHAQTTN